MKTEAKIITIADNFFMTLSFKLLNKIDSLLKTTLMPKVTKTFAENKAIQGF
jgi:hypothetical protein